MANFFEQFHSEVKEAPKASGNFFEQFHAEAETPPPSDMSAQGAAEAAAARVRQRERPPEGRAEGRLTAAVEAVPPAIGRALDEAGKTSKGLLTGELEPTPENVLPSVAMTINSATRAGAAVARAAMSPAEREAIEAGVTSIPRAANAGPAMQTAGRVLARTPLGKGLREAGQKPSDELVESISKTAAKPTGEEIAPEVAGKHIRAGIKAEEAAAEELPWRLRSMLKGQEGNEIGHVVTMARKGKGGDVNALGRIRANVPHKDWDEVRSAALARMGKTPEGGFNPDTWLESYRGLSPGGKNILFGDAKSPGSLRAHLDAIDGVSRRAASWQQFDIVPGLLAGKRAKAAIAGAVVSEPLTTLSVLIPARMLANYLSKPATAAPIAQWSLAMERLGRSGGAPSAVASFKIATNNLRNSLGEKFTDEELIKAATKSEPVQEAPIEPVSTPEPLIDHRTGPWRKMRMSENIDDITEETGRNVDKMLSGNKKDFDDFVSRFGVIETYNLLVDRLNNKEPVSREVLEYIDEATASRRRRQ